MSEEAIFVKCEDSILLKKAIAKALYSRNIEQSKISDILKLSQPMVSNYCASDDKIPDNIMELAEKISNKIINGQSTTFNTCISFSEKPYEGSFYIARKNEVISDENNRIVNNLTEAFLLLKGKNISGLIPEIKINIAMAKDNTVRSDDIAAFLNGLIIADDKVTGNNGIRFGRSKHLSSLLLYLREIIDVNAIMNIAYIEDVLKNNFSYSYLTKDFKLQDNKNNVDVLLHKGDFGIEPCAYVLGRDAVDVVNKVIKIKEEIK
jgi:hypothetical protein